jgi:hypothetical protein
MTDDGIHADATPRNNIYPITTFKDRDDWIKLLLAADGDELSPANKIVGARIAFHHNIETGQCNPSLAQLAAGSGMSDRNVRRMLRELEETGWLGTDSRGRHTHSFELRVPNSTKETELNPDSYVRDDVSNPDNSVRVHDSSTRTAMSGLPGQTGYSNPDTVVRQKRERTENRKAKEIDSPRLDLADEDSGRRSRSPSSETEADFEIWYKQYPKHVDKADARKAYLTVIKKKLATPEQLLAAAMRYAAERTGQDPKYTKNPATWLNKHSWLNEPASIGDTYSAAQQGQSNHIAVAEQIARQLMEKDGGYVQ